MSAFGNQTAPSGAPQEGEPAQLDQRVIPQHGPVADLAASLGPQLLVDKYWRVYGKPAFWCRAQGADSDEVLATEVHFRYILGIGAGVTCAVELNTNVRPGLLQAALHVNWKGLNGPRCLLRGRGQQQR